jgi:hypothetical protein
VTDDERARRAHIDDVVVAHFPRENARAERPMSANIDASQESNESHGGIIMSAADHPLQVLGLAGAVHFDL